MDDLQDVVSATELAEAVNREMRWLMRIFVVGGQQSTPLVKSPLQARAILRIEATSEALYRLEYDQRRRNLNYLSWPMQRDEGRTFMGVSIYEVRHSLPAPGWKIINPFRK